MSSANPKIKKLLLVPLIFVSVVLAGSVAQAALFCLASPGMLQPVCSYDDLNECFRDMRQQGGYCTVNFKELFGVPAVGAPVCQIDNSRAVTCIFEGLRSCQQDAIHRQAVCFMKPYRPETGDTPVPTAVPLSLPPSNPLATTHDPNLPIR